MDTKTLNEKVSDIYKTLDHVSNADAKIILKLILEQIENSQNTSSTIVRRRLFMD